MANDLTFGAWLKQRRKALDLTRQALAQRVGCAYGTVRRLESDELRPSRQLAELLAQTLKVPTASIPDFIAFARDLPEAERFDLPPWSLHQPPGAAPASPTDSTQATLPQPLTNLIGREQAVATVANLLQQPTVRLLTLTGAPGVGKTRLALAVAERLQGHFADGVAFVALAPVGEAGFVANAIAQALALPVGDRAIEPALGAALRHRQLLLLIDNMEHLLAAAPLLADLLRQAPRLKLLATSRVALRLSGEYEFPVSPLALPDPQLVVEEREQAHTQLLNTPAIALFCARAQAVQPTFSLNAANAIAIQAICQRLDGLPLAIELAAMRLKFFSPHLLLSRLEQRLPLLGDGPRDAPARQRTVEAAIGWSYDLLTPHQQTLLARFAIFAGGWTLSAAEAVCGAADDAPFSLLEALTVLVDHSLIRPVGELAGEPRFDLLQVIREYALARLEERGETARLARRHAQYYQQLAQSGAAGLRSADQPVWLRRLDGEIDNFRVALAWSLTPAGDVALGLAIAAELEWYWSVSGRIHEGRRWLEALLARTTGCTPLRALAWMGAGVLTFFAGDFAQADPFLRAAVACAQTQALPIIAGYAQIHIGSIQMMQGDLVGGAAILDQGVAWVRSAGPAGHWHLASILAARTIAAMFEGDLPAAERYAQESLQIYRQLAHPDGIATAENCLGDVLRLQGRWQEAARHYEASLAQLQRSGARTDLPAVLHNVAYGALAQGETARAQMLLQQSLKLQRDSGNQRGVAECLCGFAALAVVLGQPEAAARLFGSAATCEAASDMPLWPAEAAARAPYLSAVREQLGETTFATAVAEGKTWDREQAVIAALRIGGSAMSSIRHTTS